MAEQAGIFPGGSGVDAVTFAGALTGLARRESLRRAHRALDALDVGEERYRPTKTYSTGMRQRCKLAMSLVHDPEFLVLDEPTVGLDPPGRRQLLNIIRDLRDQGRRIIISTHIMQDADFLCDDLLLLEAGTVAYSGPVGQLLGQDVGAMVATGPGLDEEFARVLREAGVTASAPAPEIVQFSAADSTALLTFWQVAAARKAEIRSLGRDVPTLEEAVVTVMENPRGR
jgi:ABC-2 type transport system ATP-binding protein